MWNVLGKFVMDNSTLAPNLELEAVIFQVPVSLFCPMSGTAKGVVPLPIRNITLLDWLTKTSPSLLAHQASARSAVTKEAKRRLKNRFYAIMPTGTFLAQGDSHLATFSGFISIDVDHMEPAEAKRILSGLPYVAYAGESVSGSGVWALVRIPDMDEFKARFLALKRELSDVGISLDSQCSNPSRFRCYSYDEKAYFNYSAEVFTGKYYEPKRVVTTRSFSGDSDLRLNNLLRLVVEMGIDITGNRGTWLKIATAFGCKFGEAGRSSFHDISSFYAGYSEKETDTLYDSALRGGRRVDVDMIFLAAKNAGVMLK